MLSKRRPHAEGSSTGRSCCAAHWRLEVALTVLALFCCGQVNAATAGEVREAVEVTAVGVADAAPGVATSELHRRALSDARRNAVEQAHVEVESVAGVNDLRMASSRVRARTAGYVESMDILEAGRVVGADSSLYKVRVRARVRPMDTMARHGAFALNRLDSWAPRVRLEFSDDCRVDLREEVRARIAKGLLLAGVRPVGAGEFAMPVALRVEGELDATVRVDWSIDASSDADVAGPGRHTGSWQIMGEGGPDVHWWEGLSLAIARDAYTVWAAPRITTIRFEGPSEEQSRSIAGILSRAVGARVRSRGEEALEVTLPLTGDPRAFVEAALSQAAPGAEPTLTEAAFTRIVYVFQQAEDSVDQAE